MTPALESRLRHYRRRVLVRAWQYRQRAHAHGVWFGLRRVLAQASAVYAISRDDAMTLAGEGCAVDAVGAALEPPIVILLVPAGRIAHLASARPLAVQLSAALLSAECLALTPFTAPLKESARR